MRDRSASVARPANRLRAGHAGGVPDYSPEQPQRDDIDATSGPLVLAFGTEWCGFCLAADRYISPALADQAQVPVIGVEDGPGRPLGRSYRVKLWPTLVFLRDGVELDRVVRPGNRAVIDEALAKITTTPRP